MGYKYKWKPSKNAKKEFAQTMKDINIFCKENNIYQSKSNDSYYFTFNNINYRISNHSIELSNKCAYNEFGEKIRELYHANEREDNTFYIHAGKTRIIEIYNNIINGYKLDGFGNII